MPDPMRPLALRAAALGTLTFFAGAAASAPTLTPPQALFELSPRVLPAPAADPTNKYADDPAAARLGQKLFFDDSFSGALLEGDNDGSAHALGKRGEAGKVSCAGCHIPESGFLDTRSLGQQASLAAGWTRRRAISLLDVGQSTLVDWDGSHDSIWSQTFRPIEHDTEMNSARLFVAGQLFRSYRSEYESIFGPMPPLDDAARFPPLDGQSSGCKIVFQRHRAPGEPATKEICHGLPGDHAEFDGMARADQDAVTRVAANFGKALEAFLRKLSCGPSRFDRWVHGDAAALSLSEQRGAILFAGKGTCIRCHNGPYFSDERFHNVGLAAQTVSVIVNDAGDRGAADGLRQALADPLNGRGIFSDGDDGRLPASIPSSALGAFRTPKLRCVAMRPSLLHTAQFRSLEEVVAFFDRGGHPAGYPGKSALKPLGLSVNDRADLVAFLKALSGPGPEKALLAPPR